MEHFSFMLWMVLYPLTNSICNYLLVKKGKMYGKEYPSDSAWFVANAIELVMYVFVAKLLY